MLVASFGGSLVGLLVVAAFVGVPISIAVTRNRQHAEATRYSFMDGWAAGTPLASVTEFVETGPPPATPGPRIVERGVGPAGTAIRIVNGSPPARPDPWSGSPARAPLIVVERPFPDETDDEDDVDSPDIAPPASPVSILPTGTAAAQPPPLQVDSTGGGFVAPLPADPEPGTARACVLGAPRMLGWLAEPRRRAVPELACYLALHCDRAMSGEEVRMALWPELANKADGAAKSLRNSMHLLRQSLGADLVPDAGKGGYRLSEKVTTDWALFEAEIAAAVAGTPDEAHHLARALAYVRGAAFEGVVPGTYTWAWTELWVEHIDTAVSEAARRLASLALGTDDADTARWAALQGLLASPYDRELWRAMLHAARLRGPAELVRAVEHAKAVLGEDFGEVTGV